MKPSQMSKSEFLQTLARLYRVCNMADSDNPAKPEWMTPDMAGKYGCAAFDSVMQSPAFSNEDRACFYDNL